MYLSRHDFMQLIGAGQQTSANHEQENTDKRIGNFFHLCGPTRLIVFHGHNNQRCPPGKVYLADFVIF